jgi:hypothetical protein
MTDESNAAARLEEARALARAFRQYLPEVERRLYDEVLAKAGPLIRAATQDPGLGPRDAFMLSLLAQTLSMLGQVRDEIAEMRREGT